MKTIFTIVLLVFSILSFGQSATNSGGAIIVAGPPNSVDFEVKSGPKIDTIVVHAKFSPSVQTNLAEIEKQLAALKTQYETLTTMKEVIKNTFFGMYCDENRIDKDKVLKVEPMATELVIKRK